tara:strand:- start:140763 stop:141488 length:726 start_codon:yes stop_codon:yes gene_type:complete
MSKLQGKVLIVEDEKDICDILKVQLELNGLETLIFHDGAKALEYIQDSQDISDIDLFVLDRMLPGTDGLEICKFLRMYKKTKTHPILFLTALTNGDQIVEGLDAGADDYVTKPFDINIFLARVRSLLRRKQSLMTTENNEPKEKFLYEIKGLKVDTNQCKSWIDDKEVDLTLSEYKLLVAFLQQPGKVLTRNQLVEFIQDGPVHVTDRTIDTHIFGLRKKLGDYSSVIETIRGIGYRVAID